MLHTINHSPFRTTTLETAVRFILPGDPVLFLEDGVYSLVESGKYQDLVNTLTKTNPVFGLGPDIKARGLKKLLKDVKQVSYEGFVELVEEHQMNAWL